MRLFVSGGPRLPFGFRIGYLFDPLVLWSRASRNAPPNGGTFLYVIDDGEGRCKVGVSQNPLQRLRELQTGHPARLELVWCAVTPGSGFAIEQLIKRTEELRSLSGEWYGAHWRYMAAAVVYAARYLGQALQEIPVPMVPQVLEGARQEEPEGPRSFPFRRPVAFVLTIWAVAGTVIFVMSRFWH